MDARRCRPGCGERLVLAYGLLALPGFVGSVVVGQLFKIVPFLVWLHRFSPLVGLKARAHRRAAAARGAQRAQEWLMHAGLLTLVLGILVVSPALRTLAGRGLRGGAALGARNLWVLARSKP